MPLHNPPYYRYALYEAWDREMFDCIKEIGTATQYPTIVGEAEDKQQFIVTLIRTQKALNDWRDMLKDTLSSAKANGQIGTSSLIRKYPPHRHQPGCASVGHLHRGRDGQRLHR